MPMPKRFATNAERQRAYRMRQKHKPRPEPDAPPGASIKTMPSTARWRSLREQAVCALQTIQSEMQDYLDDRSEAWLESDRGVAFQEAADMVDEAASTVQGLDI